MTTQDPIQQSVSVPVSVSVAATPSSVFESSGTEQLEAYEATKVDRAALPPEVLRAIFADIHVASARVIGATIRTANYDDELATLPGSAGIREKALLYAKAASQAHTNYLNTFTPPEGFLQLIDQLKDYRESLIHEAEVLVRRKIIHAEQLEGLHRTTGYRPIVNDVKRLSSLLREVLPRLAGKSFLTLEEITSISSTVFTAEKMLELRDDKARSRVEANDIRQRAFTLMANAYDRLRRGLAYLLGDQEKVDELAPSMQVNTRRERDEEDADETDGAPPVAPAAGNSAAPGGNAAAPAPVAGFGRPSASPFIDG